MMAVASLFPFASLTDGRTAGDLPKQHPQKIKKIQSQDFQKLWTGPLWKATALLFVVHNDLGENKLSLVPMAVGCIQFLLDKDQCIPSGNVSI